MHRRGKMVPNLNEKECMWKISVTFYFSAGGKWRPKVEGSTWTSDFSMESRIIRHYLSGSLYRSNQRHEGNYNWHLVWGAGKSKTKLYNPDMLKWYIRKKWTTLFSCGRFLTLTRFCTFICMSMCNYTLFLHFVVVLPMWDWRKEEKL